MEDENMKCDICRELLSWYLDSDLQAKEMQAVEDHLSICVECSEELGLLKDMLTLARGLPEIEPPEEVCSRLLEKVKGLAETDRTIYIREEVRSEGRIEVSMFEIGQRSSPKRKAGIRFRYWSEVVREFNGTYWGFLETELA
jgi:hypothetical protein